jgi:hypothetical protein
LEFELLTLRRYSTKSKARTAAARFIDRDRFRRHSSCEFQYLADHQATPTECAATAAEQEEAT